MNFSELPPSKQWAALKSRGETFAEVWFKPEGEPFGLTFRIPRRSFQILGTCQQITAENLLRAVGIAPDEVESWRDDRSPPSGESRDQSEMKLPLPVPPPDAAHLNVHVSLKPPQAVAPDEGGESQVPEAKWQYLEGRWNAILGLEAAVDNLRMSLESVRMEMESSARRALPLEVKLNALSGDVVQWNKVKSRIQYAVPKVREFVHRSTWATGSPERKRLTEVFENNIQRRVPFPRMDELLVQFDSLLKDRQNLSAQGNTVLQECRGILAEYQATMRTLQSNAAANASRKKDSMRSRGKSL